METSLKNNAEKIGTAKTDVLVSVIVPTFRRSELLHKAIGSLISQSYKNFEVIVIDDNDDETYKIGNEKYFNSLNDERIVYIRNSANIGSAKSRNKGLSVAKGKYVTFLDDDDYYSPDKIEIQLRETIKNGYKVSICNLILIDDDENVIDKRRRRYFKNGEPLLTMHLKYHLTGTASFMAETEFVRKIGGFCDSDLGDDFIFMLGAIENTDKIGHVDLDGAFCTIHNLLGLSAYPNKLKIESSVMEVKSKYFNRLKRKDIRFIKMRHFAVLAVTYKKGKKYIICFINGIKSFAYSPVGFFRLYFGKCR